MTTPHNPNSNAKAERAIGIIMTLARSIMIDAGLPRYFAGEAIHTAALLHNVLPKRSNPSQQPPYTMFWNTELDVNTLRVVGSRARWNPPSGDFSLQSGHLSLIQRDNRARRRRKIPSRLVEEDSAEEDSAEEDSKESAVTTTPKKRRRYPGWLTAEESLRENTPEEHARLFPTNDERQNRGRRRRPDTRNVFQNLGPSSSRSYRASSSLKT
jgi:hypothetical protein